LFALGLAALICAYHDAADAPGGLRATLPLAGRTLIERQARLAAAAGAAPVVILVERLPAELVAAIDRMRSEGVSAIVARGVEDAAEAIRAEDGLLVFADGLLAQDSHVARFAGGRGPALLTLPETGADDRFERIDADTRWAGLALLDGDLLRRTAAKLQDWDLQSTLLRRAVQEGARQVAARGGSADQPVVIAERAADLAAAHARIVSGAGTAREDWASRYLLAPVEASAGRALMPSSITPGWLYVGAGTLAGLGVLLFLQGWLLVGLLMLLLATPLDGIAERLASMRLQPSGEGTLPARALPWLSAAALGALGYSLSEARGWGCMALAAATVAFLAALFFETRGRRLAERLFFAERKGMTWLMLPFAATGAWVSGLWLLAAYAAGSFFWAQREVHRAPAPEAQD
jgi:hypothetical protein